MPTPAQATAIAHLREANEVFGTVLTAEHMNAEVGPVGNLIARYGMYGFRQVQAIITLSEASDDLHLQVTQLVRSLVEAWFYAAWLTAPEDEEGKLQKAIGLVTVWLRSHRDKLDYQSQHFRTSPIHYLALSVREQETEDEAATHGRVFPSDLRQGMEGLGAPDRHIVYRWDSDAVHASGTGLAQLVDQTGDVTLLGVVGDPGQMLARLATAWKVSGDLYEIVTSELGYDLPPSWSENRIVVSEELADLLAAT